MKKRISILFILCTLIITSSVSAEKWENVITNEYVQVYLDTDSIYCDYNKNAINFRLKNIISDKGKDIRLADLNYNSEQEKSFRNIAYQIEDKCYLVLERGLYTKQNSLYDINGNLLYVKYGAGEIKDLGKNGSEYAFDKMVMLKVFEYL